MLTYPAALNVSNVNLVCPETKYASNFAFWGGGVKNGGVLVYVFMYVR